MSLKDYITWPQGQKKQATFSYYRDGSLWYRVDGPGDTELIFPVPVEDIGTATFNATEQAILLMRYIRKYLDRLEKAREDQTAG